MVIDLMEAEEEDEEGRNQKEAMAKAITKDLQKRPPLLNPFPDVDGDGREQKGDHAAGDRHDDEVFFRQTLPEKEEKRRGQHKKRAEIVRGSIEKHLDPAAQIKRIEQAEEMKGEIRPEDDQKEFPRELFPTPKGEKETAPNEKEGQKEHQ